MKNYINNLLPDILLNNLTSDCKRIYNLMDGSDVCKDSCMVEWKNEHKGIINKIVNKLTQKYKIRQKNNSLKKTDSYWLFTSQDNFYITR